MAVQITKVDLVHASDNKIPGGCHCTISSLQSVWDPIIIIYRLIVEFWFKCPLLETDIHVVTLL